MDLMTKVRSFIDGLINKSGPGTTTPSSGGPISQKLSFSRHHMIYFALIFGVLGAILLWQSFGAPAPVIATVEAENMLLPEGASVITTNNASAGRAVKMTKNGTMVFTGSLNSDTASISIKAYGGRCDNIWPRMTVSIDDKAVFNLDAAASSWQDF